MECHRALVRAAATGQIPEASALFAAAALAAAAAHWTVVEVSGEISERASQRFPAEPVRTLDALHLATVLFLAQQVGPVEILSTDERVVRNARLLGLPVATLGAAPGVAGR